MVLYFLKKIDMATWLSILKKVVSSVQKSVLSDVGGQQRVNHGLYLNRFVWKLLITALHFIIGPRNLEFVLSYAPLHNFVLIFTLDVFYCILEDDP